MPNSSHHKGRAKKNLKRRQRYYALKWQNSVITRPELIAAYFKKMIENMGHDFDVIMRICRKGDVEIVLRKPINNFIPQENLTE